MSTHPGRAPEPDPTDHDPSQTGPRGPGGTGSGQDGSRQDAVGPAGADVEVGQVEVGQASVGPAGIQDPGVAGSRDAPPRIMGWRPGDPLPDPGEDVDELGFAIDRQDHPGVTASTMDNADETGHGDGTYDDEGDDGDKFGGYGLGSDTGLTPAQPEPVVPVNWNTLDALQAEQEWWQLDAFVYWLRDDFGLTPQELPPLWHRHPELVWELSALRTAWLAAHAPDAHPGSPLMWLRDLGDSRRRLRDWVQRCGTTLSTDRPTRRTTWPGEQPATSPTETAISDRTADFAVFVAHDLARRRQAEAEALAEITHARTRRLQRLRRAWHLPIPPTNDPAPIDPERDDDRQNGADWDRPAPDPDTTR